MALKYHVTYQDDEFDADYDTVEAAERGIKDTVMDYGVRVSEVVATDTVTGERTRLWCRWSVKLEKR